MLILRWLMLGLLVLAVAAIAAGQAGLLQGKVPTDIGVHQSKLKPPSPTPNSVSSQAALYPDHPQRSYADIAPLALRGDGPATMARLQRVVAAMPGARIVESTPDYLYVQYTSSIMKFIDDVEFWYDATAQVIQVRSASRVGERDLGVNRKRVDAMRLALAAQP